MNRAPRWIPIFVALAFVVAIAIALAACATAPSGPRPFVVDCNALFTTLGQPVSLDEPASGGESDTEGGSIATAPSIRNWGELMREIGRRYVGRHGRVDRSARVLVLVGPDGRTSHGCVRDRSGSLSYDRLALAVARDAIFRPALDPGGRPTEAWSAFDVSVKVRR